VVAVTGSNGKTTTKDIISHILSKKYKVLSTEKNFNNEIGVPQTLMKLDESYQAVVVELGMRGPGQIRELAEIVEPVIGVVTNIGESHFELLGSYEAIARAKCELIECVEPKGTVVLNADDKWFTYCAGKANTSIITFGIDNKAEVKLIKKENLSFKGYSLKVKVGEGEHTFYLPLLGNHNIYNSLAAISVAYSLAMSCHEIAEALKTVKPSDKRLEIIETCKGWIIINDTYNASPSSMRKALEVLGEIQGEGRKFVVLGDMLELGEIAVNSHQSIGALVASIGAYEVHTIGDLGKEIAQGAKKSGMPPERVYSWDNKDKTIDYLKKGLKEKDIVLIKGSRRMKMEEISEALAEVRI
jgi:UDP-N-acetylmuramoyl-tripeptide--D-alanyl-D-alanine ligase